VSSLHANNGCTSRRFGHAHPFDLHARLVVHKPRGERLRNKLRERFSGWIDAIKRRCVVERAIRERFEQFFEHARDLVEIAEQLFTIKALAANAYDNTPIVPMHSLALACYHDRMSGSELVLNFNGKWQGGVGHFE
jgi:hypothetical protein